MGLIHGILAKMFPPQPEPVAELRVGALAMVRGRVVPRDLMDSPLTGDRCVYYKYTIENWRQSRVAGVGADGFWEVSRQDEAILEFYVEDESGRAIVAPERVRVDLGRKVKQTIIDLEFNRRARHLIIEADDIIEVSAEAAESDDLFDENRLYRAPAGRILLRAPEGGRLQIRLVDKPGQESEPD